MTSTLDQSVDPTIALLTTLQAVTVTLVVYLVYSSKTSSETNSVDTPRAVEIVDVKKEEVDEPTTEEAKVVQTQVQARSVRGVNVYGPYKKVRRKRWRSRGTTAITSNQILLTDRFPFSRIFLSTPEYHDAVGQQPQRRSRRRSSRQVQGKALDGVAL